MSRRSEGKEVVLLSAPPLLMSESAEEFAALCDADCIAEVQRSGYALGGYADAPRG